MNLSKTRYMCIEKNNKNTKKAILIDGTKIEYSKKEKYLGHFLTDDNNMQRAIELDIEERSKNLFIKYRNFINNHRESPRGIRFKVLEACLCTTLLNNCETWGSKIPRRVHVLYHYGIKLALQVRNSTPTALIFLESRLPSLEAIIRKRQLKFWINLTKETGTEMSNLIEKAKSTKYVTHYKKLEERYETPENAYQSINSKFYEERWNEIRTATPEKTKMKTYHQIYQNADTLPHECLTTTEKNTKIQDILTSYILSSHNLETERGKWVRKSKGERYCKHCCIDVEEDLVHFLFDCEYFKSIRNSYSTFPEEKSTTSFFHWNQSGLALSKLHSNRKVHM